MTAPETTRLVSEALLREAKEGRAAPDIAFPTDYPIPYSDHRRTCGMALYSAMGIAREDKQKRNDAWLRNYELFDAPHLAVVSHDRRLGQYATLDVGVWLGVFLTLAAAMGIDACPMASTAAYPGPLRDLLQIPPEEVILFGIALGLEDPAVPANSCRTARDPVEHNVRFLGFADR